eukprot:TRINITY_DN3638_c0_g1_i10.p2 TRINITY_DN3638_c0_g1~~TRINITY_DN3638_c0_g1_i10.p2  ORF type:complete len:347 (-),score=82.73 TRINITY_DN3638_c0_g1_i10:47-1087(-)
MQDEIIFKTARAIMFVDSDVVFTHNGDNKGMGKLYKYLTSDPDLGGAAGEIEVWRWTKNPVTITQYFEYKSNQFMAKTFENWFGMVTCLPGAFCMVRPQALEHVLSCYLQDANTIVEKNQLDLGEDRTMTTLLLQAGWRTGYLTSATALTDVPQTLPQLIRQRRRWINSTVVNMWLLLRHVNRWCSAFPLLVSLGVELISSFTLPTAVLMLFFQMGASVGLNALLVIAVIILWVLLLLVLSLTADLDRVHYWFEASAVVGAVVIFLMIVYTVQSADLFLHKYWAEVVVVVGWVVIIVLSSVIHRQWTSVLGVLAPVTWLFMSPTMYVIVPLYAICNFDDVSWGTRG